ncbi:hypothetical protein KC929_00890 [Patescibacteria group bacterium]|nr:hypothetical protein [Patescibacteria group bacterium]
MDSKKINELYKKQESDLKVTPFEGEVGFSLVRNYPLESLYAKDDKKVFIKIALLEGGLFYSVHMVEPSKRKGSFEYNIVDGYSYKKKVTNFVSDIKDNEFSFDKTKKKVIHSKSKKEFSLNEFIEILYKNHLSDRLFWKRQKNFLVKWILISIFWLLDKHYNYVEVSINEYKFKNGELKFSNESKKIEPFFKYFEISRNLLFLLLLLVFPISYFFDDYSLSNPLVVSLFFLILLLSEKLYLFFVKQFENFFLKQENTFSQKKKNNLIEKLHIYHQRNQFDLKIYDL